MLNLLKVIIASLILTFAYCGFAIEEESGRWSVVQDDEQIKDESSANNSTDESSQTDETNMSIERQIKEKAKKRFSKPTRAASGEESRRVPRS